MMKILKCLNKDIIPSEQLKRIHVKVKKSAFVGNYTGVERNALCQALCHWLP